MRVGCLLLLLFTVACSSYPYQHFANKAASIVNELFDDTEYYLKNIPYAGDVTITSFLISDFQLRSSADALLLAELAASISVVYDDDPIDIDFVLSASFALTEQLVLCSGSISITNMSGFFGSIKATIAQGLVNRLIEGFVGKSIPLDLSLPSFLTVSKGNSQFSGITVDVNKLIEQRNKGGRTINEL